MFSFVHISSRRSIIVALLLASAGPAWALQPLSEFLQGARRTNLDNREAALNADEQESEALIALGHNLPALSVRGVYTRNQYNVAFDIPQGYSLRLLRPNNGNYRRRPWRLQQPAITMPGSAGLALGPVGEDLFGFFHLVLRTGKTESQFPCPASDDYFDGGQTTALHSQVELLVSFVRSVVLETCHG